MTIKENPHYTLDTVQLAEWLRNQSSDSWWTVDGDAFLAERLDFPCPGNEIADVLQGVNKKLLLLDPKKSKDATGQIVRADELNPHVAKDSDGDRVLEFAWEDSPEFDWLLIEDTDIPQQSLDLKAGE